MVGERPADVAAGIRTLREIGIKTLKLNGTEWLAMIDSAATADPAIERIAAVHKMGHALDQGCGESFYRVYDADCRAAMMRFRPRKIPKPVKCR